MNSINNNIQFTQETENNGLLPFLNTLVSRTDEGFSKSVYCKNFAVSVPPHAHSCHSPRQKMASFYTYINHVLNIGSDLTSFNSKSQYLKATALDRGCNPTVVDKALFKMKNPYISHPSHSNPNINTFYLFFFQIPVFFHC